MNPNFKAAVGLAREWLATTGLKKWQTVHTVEPTELLYVFGLEIEHEFDDHPFCGSKYIVDDLSLNSLCMEAERDKGAYDLLVRIVVSRLLRNEPLTQQISVFAGLVLAGKKKAPPPEGKRLARTFITNFHIVYLAHHLARLYDLDLTRNDATKVEESVCDAIAIACGQLGVSRTARSVKELIVSEDYKRVRDVVHAINLFRERKRSDPMSMGG